MRFFFLFIRHKCLMRVRAILSRVAELNKRVNIYNTMNVTISLSIASAWKNLHLVITICKRSMFLLRMTSLYIQKISHKATHSGNQLSNGTQCNGRIVRTSYALWLLLIKSFRNDFSLSLPFLSFLFISSLSLFYFISSVFLKIPDWRTIRNDCKCFPTKLPPRIFSA